MGKEKEVVELFWRFHGGGGMNGWGEDKERRQRMFGGLWFIDLVNVCPQFFYGFSFCPWFPNFH